MPHKVSNVHLDRLPTTAAATATRPTMQQRQAFFIENPMHPLVVIAPALAAQHHRYTLAAVVDPRLRDLTQTQADGTVVKRL